MRKRRAVKSESLRGAQYRPDVPGILDSVEQHQPPGTVRNSRAIRLLRDGEDVTPEGTLFDQGFFVLRGGQYALVECVRGGKLTHNMLCLGADGSVTTLRCPNTRSYVAAADGFVFYDQYEWQLAEQRYVGVGCHDIATGEEWLLTVDRTDLTRELYDYTTDGVYLYACAPWSSAHTVWRLISDEDGRPAALEYVDTVGPARH